MLIFNYFFQTPLGQLHLRDARIEDIDNTNDSDDETDVTKATKHVIAIWPPFQGPTYLMLPSQHEKVCMKIYLEFGNIN